MSDDKPAKAIWTRRKFLASGVVGSIATTRAITTFSAAAPVLQESQQPPRTARLDSQQCDLARAAMDEIIPAGDGMPAASAVGGVEYLSNLAALEPAIHQRLADTLSGIDTASHKQFGMPYLTLSSTQRVEALTAFEKLHGDAFASLRDYIYEAYYTQPEVWKLVGYKLHPTDEQGPAMKPFNVDVLAAVRTKHRHYREHA